MEGRLWIVVLSGFVMCAMAFGMGSNDAGMPLSLPSSLSFSFVANSWGTSVGSGAISLRTAVTIGAIMEFLGAITLGSGVSDTIQKGVSDITSENCWACGFCHSEMSVYQAGMFGALISTALFLILSSFTSMPVSATHAVVGGVVGMTWAGVGSNCLNWAFDGLGGIVASWVISPVLSGIIGASTFLLTDYFIFRSSIPRERALIALPMFITLVTFVITFLICLKSPGTKVPSLLFFLSLIFNCISGFRYLDPLDCISHCLGCCSRSLHRVHPPLDEEEFAFSWPHRTGPPLPPPPPFLTADRLILRHPLHLLLCQPKRNQSQLAVHSTSSMTPPSLRAT
jgi:phosphate/sulfate permease